MKIGIIGDAHISNNAPLRRKDNYFETQLGKLNQAFNIFKKNGCEIVLQVGDLFDNHMVSNNVISTVGRLLMGKNVYCVAGQHDVPGNTMSTFANSPVNVLASFDILAVLDEKPISFNDKTIHIYGSSWAEDVPEVQNKDAFNILVTHRMIGDTELFSGQLFTPPNVFLRNNPDFNLVVVGDFHYRFISEYKGRKIINAGALVRKSIDERDLKHKPAVVVFDTETKEHEVIELEIQPAEDIFDFDREIKTDNLKVKELVLAMRGRENKTTRWKELIEPISKELGYEIQVVQERLNDYIGEQNDNS